MGDEMLGRSTTNNEQMCTWTSKTNNSISCEKLETTTFRKVEQRQQRSQIREHNHETARQTIFTTAITTQSLKPHPTKTNFMPNTTSNARENNTVTGSRDEHRDLCRQQGNIQQFGQFIIFKNAAQVQFDQRIKCVWATFTSHRHEFTSWKYPLRDRLNPFDATATPCLFNA